MKHSYFENFLIQKIRSIRNKELIYFVSFPKSGRTWLQVMVAKAYSIHTKKSISDILNNRLKSYRNVNNKKLAYIQFGHGYRNSNMCLGNYFPKNLYKNKKILLLVRDPRDIIVSFFYYNKYFYNNFDGTLSDFIYFDNNSHSNSPTLQRFGINAIINYLNSWVTHKDAFRTFEIIFFEDIKTNTDSELKRVLTLMGIEYDNAFISDIISYGSFQNMKKLEETNELDWYGLKGTGKGAKVRAGKIGGYKEELSAKDIDFLNNTIKKNLSPVFERYF